MPLFALKKNAWPCLRMSSEGWKSVVKSSKVGWKMLEEVHEVFTCRKAYVEAWITPAILVCIGRSF